MKVYGEDVKNGEKVEFESSRINNDFIDAMMEFRLTDEQMRKTIDGLNVPADVKSMLYALSKVTFKTGQIIIKIGRKLIDCVTQLFKEFPNASYGMIFGAIAGFLVGAVPFLGAVLGPFVAPLLLAFGFFKGLTEDIKEKALKRKIIEINETFTPLKD